MPSSDGTSLFNRNAPGETVLCKARFLREHSGFFIFLILGFMVSAIPSPGLSELLYGLKYFFTFRANGKDRFFFQESPDTLSYFFTVTFIEQIA